MLTQWRTTFCLLIVTLSACTLVAQTFTFTPPQSVLTLPPPMWSTFNVQMLDVNGDGKTDLLVNDGINYNMYLGDGKGGFSSPPLSTPTFDPAPVHPSPTFLDVNGDGIDDLVMGFSSFAGDSFSTTNGQFIVSLGDGQGSFDQTTIIGNLPAGDGSADDPLVAADFNGDGKVDFALLTVGGFTGDGSFQPAAITLFLNTGKGTFAEQKTMWLEGSGLWAMVAGDFNGDGRQDLAWTQVQSPHGPPYPIHYVYGNGDATFGALRTYWTDTAPLGLASGDLNGDHKTDLVVSLSPGPRYLWRIATLFARQTGGFYWAKNIMVDTPTTRLKLLNLNHDGHLDVNYQQVFMRAGLAGGAWGPKQVISGDARPPDYLDPFVSLVKGGLPAFFNISTDASQNIHVVVQINTSK